MSGYFTQGEPIKGVSDFVARAAKVTGALYLRGVSNENWTLRTSIARLGDKKVVGKPVMVTKATVLVQEKALLHRFRRHT
jgi:hypothetical protein